MTLLDVRPADAVHSLHASVITAPMRLSDAIERRSPRVRENAVIPIIIVIAIIVLLALAVTIVAASIAMCASRGGVFDSVIDIGRGLVRITCHRL